MNETLIKIGKVLQQLDDVDDKIFKAKILRLAATLIETEIAIDIVAIKMLQSIHSEDLKNTEKLN